MNCLLPDHGVFISPEGYLTSCCVSMHDPFGNVRDQHPIEIFYGPIAAKFRQDFRQGNLPRSCDLCINKEHYNLRTAKTNIISREKHSDSKIVYADITLGNICQLNCVMCNETFSHSWAKIKNRPEKIWSVTKEKMSEILEMLEGVSHIEIKGGDPFNMPYFKEFLDRLYATNPEVHLLFLTSGVYINDFHIESLKKFKNFNIGVSLEADKELYQYIRGGHHSIDGVFANLRKCAEHGVLMEGFYISSILSFYNIDSWVDDHVNICDRFEQQFGFRPNLALNVVLEPRHQSAFLANQSVREKFYEDFLQADLRIDKDTYRHILENRTVEDIKYKNIVDEIEYYNKIRGLRLLDLKPHLLDMIDARYLK